jgi:hypothetical protein
MAQETAQIIVRAGASDSKAGGQVQGKSVSFNGK